MNPASSDGVSIGVPEAVRLVADMVANDRATLETPPGQMWPRNAIALRNLSRSVFAIDGCIRGLGPEEFSLCDGHLLFRGFSSFQYVRENLNGEWFGTGFMSDGNYYTGYEARAEAIDEYGFSNARGSEGWAMVYKLCPSVNLAERAWVEYMPRDHFIQDVSVRYSVNEDTLATLYERGSDNGIRAVLLGYNGMVDLQMNYYVIYNHRALVYSANCTPWAYGLEPLPEELAASEGKSEGMDKSCGIRLNYEEVAKLAKQALEEVQP